jgi:hypothetical protein
VSLQIPYSVPFSEVTGAAVKQQFSVLDAHVVIYIIVYIMTTTLLYRFFIRLLFSTSLIIGTCLIVPRLRKNDNLRYWIVPLSHTVFPVFPFFNQMELHRMPENGQRKSGNLILAFLVSRPQKAIIIIYFILNHQHTQHTVQGFDLQTNHEPGNPPRQLL